MQTAFRKRNAVFLLITPKCYTFSMSEEELVSIIIRDPVRRSVIEAMAALDLPDAWIAGGFVRNAVWDSLFGEGSTTPINDVDVVYFKALDSYGVDQDTLLEIIQKDWMNPVWEEEDTAVAALSSAVPGLSFEVKNQARMHISSVRIVAQEPYKSMSDAVSGWVETATAIGIRMNEDGTFSVLAPYGLEDLFQGIIRPTQPAYSERARERADAKGWLTLWPKLRFEEAC